MMRSGWSDYAARFVDTKSVESYDRLYGEGTYDDYVWALERPAVVESLRRERERRGRLRLLDFACGTGRILQAVDEVADEITGVDISAEMARRAAAVSPRTNVRIGCVLTEDVLTGPYDAVTVFRFFVNAPQGLRLPILRKIRQHMEQGALLVFNNHGHCPSLRSLTIRVPRPRPQQPNELRHRDIVDLLDASGFRIERRCGFSLFPPSLHRALPASVLRRADAAAASPNVRTLAGRMMIEQLYIARAVSQP
ncbi:methyltransferase domain-containing protein [Streptomyces canus]|uniref:SAM-dependent methyltransferase n=1 Tax=Streptomyces canus TaxID=58343 RepID=A0AAW8FG19_9ACTN|nr:class I SAM-dependent methyltransferase [Streptomyces canus]MDQ0762557.1 SAM-dependent methyltransferase [Streptomyces canus]MDQ0908974.1 SAM-dependent methyltransferase [Streptomyces canus]MDQ1069003.1 SAM-dependent methyltransferase [Streptomyces canus]